MPPESPQYFEFISEINSFVSFDATKIRQEFSDSSISLHFLYITKSQMSYLDVESIGPRDMALQDMSMNIFNIFNGVAKATGGLTASSTNGASLFKEASAASENHNLLYYSPKD